MMIPNQPKYQDNSLKKQFMLPCLTLMSLLFVLSTRCKKVRAPKHLIKCSRIFTLCRLMLLLFLVIFKCIYYIYCKMQAILALCAAKRTFGIVVRQKNNFIK
ncbi:hypothetical protein GLYMA_09G162900v4 [Glycine max]|uniref:Uncharacterized protein n=1 Tax=Glycine max TaxID=3847 RepID=K7LE95_SOYBN|nr:hypothetical protein GYH30_025238 [Glycine max]KRH38859.1 hypothetical protein GLYMA_09G162900v4 [Glycine max]